MQSGTMSVSTSSRREFVDVTMDLAREIKKTGVGEGVLYVYNPHTTAGVTINEGADPAVQRDILAVFQQVIPEHFNYHHMEGNSPAHVMASLVGSSAVVFISNGRLELGTWQKIFFCEFDGPRSRQLKWRILE